jgi:5-methylcytosine-specific restriction enzyme B
MSDVQESDLVTEGALPPEDFTNDVERIQEIARFDVEIPSDVNQRLENLAADLLVPEGLLKEATAALAAGHLVLQGPPGTGKSSLARALCRAFNCQYLPVTAHEDWSVFEVIGRQELRVTNEGKEEIVPVDGYFTKAVISCAGAVVRHFDHADEPQAVWLFIDELNRAHLDKAFGELFTVLGTDEPVAITLPDQREGNRELVNPRRFRIIATLNSYDRQFVNSLSQGLRRRFTFITVDVPPRRSEGEAWTYDGDDRSIAVREFEVVSERAAQRVAARNSEDDDEAAAQYLVLLRGDAEQALISLFGLAERVRYSGKDASSPYLPIGTAQLIDTVELFLARAISESANSEELLALMDWAAAVKLAPLFEADTVNHTHLSGFAEALPPPFNRRLRRELMQIVAAGLYFVE